MYHLSLQWNQFHMSCIPIHYDEKPTKLYQPQEGEV
jgi:hypothetical protein